MFEQPVVAGSPTVSDAQARCGVWLAVFPERISHVLPLGLLTISFRSQVCARAGGYAADGLGRANQISNGVAAKKLHQRGRCAGLPEHVATACACAGASLGREDQSEPLTPTLYQRPTDALVS